MGKILVRSWRKIEMFLQIIFVVVVTKEFSIYLNLEKSNLLN